MRSSPFRLFALTCAAFGALAAPHIASASTISTAHDRAWWDRGHGVRPPDYSGFVRTSQYVRVRDGVRLAIDTYLPKGAPAGLRLPTILSQTRYLRAAQYKPQFGGKCEFADVGVADYVTSFVTHGYAYVVVDVRGTGASFGSRPTEFSKPEILDGSDVVDWIARQKWSNGSVGTTGISYLGTTAELLLSNHNPHVVASAPLFAGFDFYKELNFPGGIENIGFDIPWSGANYILDNGDISILDPQWLRPCPVDADPHGTLLAKARAEHRFSNPIGQAYDRIDFRDDAVFGYTVDDSSAFRYRKQINDSKAAIYQFGSWDDSGYASGNVNRYINAPRYRQRMTIGPWSHGGQYYYEPGVHGVVPAQYDQLGELLRYFDFYMTGRDDLGFSKQPLVHYYTTGLDRWQSANQWPPAPMEYRQYRFTRDGGLRRDGSDGASSRTLVFPIDSNTGSNARWHTTLGGYPVFYAPRQADDARLFSFTSAPLRHAAEVTGETVATVYIAENEQDFELFAYLEDVGPDGEANYVTEGELRASHSKLGSLPYRTLSPSHPELRRDHVPLKSHVLRKMVISLVADSHLFKRGHRIRVSLAGTDVSYFKMLAPTPPTATVYFGDATPSELALPMAEEPSYDDR